MSPFRRHRHADQTAPVPGHEVDRFGRHLLGGNRQIALVLAVLVVDDDDHAAVADGLDGVLDGRKRTLTAGDTDLRILVGHRAVRAICAARATYLPTMSHSRLTRSRAASACRFVCSQVKGMIITSNSPSRSAAIVRLTP